MEKEENVLHVAKCIESETAPEESRIVLVDENDAIINRDDEKTCDYYTNAYLSQILDTNFYFNVPYIFSMSSYSDVLKNCKCTYHDFMVWDYNDDCDFGTQRHDIKSREDFYKDIYGFISTLSFSIDDDRYEVDMFYKVEHYHISEVFYFDNAADFCNFLRKITTECIIDSYKEGIIGMISDNSDEIQKLVNKNTILFKNYRLDL